LNFQPRKDQLEWNLAHPNPYRKAKKGKRKDNTIVPAEDDAKLSLVQICLKRPTIPRTPHSALSQPTCGQNSKPCRRQNAAATRSFGQQRFSLVLFPYNGSWWVLETPSWEHI
jgi:hypothetical protein